MSLRTLEAQVTPPHLCRMSPLLATLAALSSLLRTGLLIGAIALTVVAAVDWAVRTRRINPFSGVARLMRSRVEPLLVGIERTVVRAGGHPSSTPWWAVVAYVVAAVLLMALVDMIIGIVAEAAFAASMGGAGIVVVLVRWTFALLRIALLVRVISSWLPGLARSRWLAWSYVLTEWMLRPLRRIVPSFGMMDVTPIVAYFALQLAQWLVESVLLSSFRA